MSKHHNDDPSTVYTTRTEAQKVTVSCDGVPFEVSNGGSNGLNLITLMRLDQRPHCSDVNLDEEVTFEGTEIFLTNDGGSVAAQLPAGRYLMNPRQVQPLTDAELDALDLDHLPTATYGAYIFQE
ncbi:hypothetical protein DA798_09820 [Lactobacillus sp. PFC-70]|uniref:hypothetical protein n=1 Tax=Levilactobacillus namurensis TaxID=380393 RepID=UPI000D30C2A3|nr:hypothetical protein [Levilactobacillus namurensis]MCW3777391.1 hypothetical protein [Levilactobacillus namurensis]MDT7018542.1 hypothetical protein [Levilactobacillus namurensis]PTM21507.1 hypothetical protein DA798_09820 [Lactobacillus sp. PFC-70]WNN64475.1 hypothetical protein RIN67_07070 [Levilactobacillus namurensis]